MHLVLGTGVRKGEIVMTGFCKALLAASLAGGALGVRAGTVLIFR